MGKKQRFKSAQKLAYEQYLDSDHWKTLRRAKLTLNPFCQVCPKVGELLHVHHVNYRDYYSCTVDDLVTLCEGCHNDVHKALKRVRAQSCDYPLPMIGPLLEKFRNGELKRVTRSEFRKSTKSERKRVNKRLANQRRALRNRVHKICEYFWKYPSIDSLVGVRDQLTKFLEEREYDGPDVETVFLNHAAEAVPEPGDPF